MTAKAPRIPLSSVLIKPAGPDCNMACTYCFYLDKGKMFPGPVHRMSDKVLHETIRQVMEQSAQQVSFGWQGGEPTLMGLEFFQKVVSLQEKFGDGKSVGNGLQTNGILLDGSWAEFLRAYRFLLGLSLDGPQHVHERYRRLRGGQGNWQEVADRAKMLLDAGVEVNALSVVTDYSSHYPDELYGFFKEIGLTHMQFIPCIETDPGDPSRKASYSVSPEEYGRFLIRLFDLWLADVHEGVASTSVRYFDSVFHTYVGLIAPDCTLADRCGNYLVIEHTGDVFACDFFVEPEWKVGNVLDGRLIDMLNSERQRSFGNMKAARPDFCQNCPWLAHCRGGCTKDRLRDPSDRGNTHFCLSYKMFFDHADISLKELASSWLRRQKSAATVHPGWRAVAETARPERNAPCPCGSGKKFKRCCGMGGA